MIVKRIMESAADKARQSTGNRPLPLPCTCEVRDNKSGPEPVRQHDSGPSPHHSTQPRSEMPTSMPPRPPEAYTKPAERHGTWADYNAGCRCDECRNAARLYQKRRVYEGRPRRVSSLGVTRRIQALACLGWDMYAIAREVGTGRETVRQWTLHATVYRSTHERMDKVYERLSMRLPPENTKSERANVARARNRARREGWAPPLAWDDIDDPNERPGIRDASPVVDPVVVERRLSGDKSVPVTKAERVEIVRRGKAAGLSLRELEERCGITKPERYIEREEAA